LRIPHREPRNAAHTSQPTSLFPHVKPGGQLKEGLAALETTLGHAFSTPLLLVRALTHKSLANDQAAHEGDATEDRTVPQIEAVAAGVANNERLEFLGDAVLGLIVSEELFSAHPTWQEGELSRVRAQLVSRKHMAEVAVAIGLNHYLRLSPGEDRGGLRNRATVLSNSMEAVLAALYLDGGLEPVRIFVRRSVMGAAAEQLADELRSGAALGNFKSALQEQLQAEKAGTPVYRVQSESGPDHRKRFLVEVRLKSDEGQQGKALARGIGSNKKLAEQDAARRALDRLAGRATAANSLHEGSETSVDEEEQPAS
jgi:ribonuclease-3